jgi:hypothetical protein
MPIALSSDPTTLAAHAPHWLDDKIAVLLTGKESQFFTPLPVALDNLVVVDIAGPRMRRLNFDTIHLAIVDLPAEFLLGPAGRRLLDALGHLAREHLTLGFAGPATATAGAYLLNGVTAGLNLIPQTVVLPDVQQVPDLRVLLEQVSRAKRRLLALDGPITVTYHHTGDQVEVHGDGSVLLAAFHASLRTGQTNARLHVLRNGMRAGWP